MIKYLFSQKQIHKHVFFLNPNPKQLNTALRIGEEPEEWREKLAEWAACLVYLACLGFLLLLTIDTNKPHNEMRAHNWMVGLSSHQP